MRPAVGPGHDARLDYGRFRERLRRLLDGILASERCRHTHRELREMHLHTGRTYGLYGAPRRVRRTEMDLEARRRRPPDAAGPLGPHPVAPPHADCGMLDRAPERIARLPVPLVTRSQDRDAVAALTARTTA